MNSIRYTNVLLTLIACCLLIIAGRGLGIVREATAQGNPPVQRVVIAGYETHDGKVVYFPALTLTQDGSLRMVDTQFTFNKDDALRVVDIMPRY